MPAGIAGGQHPRVPRPPAGRLHWFRFRRTLPRCSRAVVRKDVDLLNQEGLVITAQGKGTYVRERPRTRRHGMDRYSRSRWSGQGKALLIAQAEEQGLSANQVLRDLAEVPAPPAVAKRIGVQPGTPV